MSDDKTLDFTKSLENAKKSIGKVFEDIMTKSREKLKSLKEMPMEVVETPVAQTENANRISNSASKTQKKKATDDVIEVSSLPSTSNKK